MGIQLGSDFSWDTSLFWRAQNTPGLGLLPELPFQHSVNQPSHTKAGILQRVIWGMALGLSTRQVQKHFKDRDFSTYFLKQHEKCHYYRVCLCTLHLAPTNFTFWFNFISGIQMNPFHAQDKVLTMYCCWKHWSAYRLEPRPYVRARALTHLKPNLGSISIVFWCYCLQEKELQVRNEMPSRKMVLQKTYRPSGWIQIPLVQRLTMTMLCRI